MYYIYCRMESYGGKNKNLNMDDEYLDPGVLANEKPVS